LLHATCDEEAARLQIQRNNAILLHAHEKAQGSRGQH
jgi:hypothetical protein